MKFVSIFRRSFAVQYNNLLVDGFAGAIGQTPLIKLKSLSEETGCNVLAKAEFMNPSYSVKDRAALFITRDAEERGLLRPGGTIVEGTAGNTGIGLAHIAKAKGYKCVIFMPNTQSAEKVQLLRALGAEVHQVPVVPYDDPMNFNHQAKRYAEERENCVWTDQFDNIANRYGHFATTGPEIWAQTKGKIDALTMATGTGGTLAGTAMFLKQKSKSIQVVLADPPGSALHDFFSTGELLRSGSSITEGIGQGRVTANLKDAPIDWSLRVPDSDTIRMVFRALDEEGLFLGASSCLNLCAARDVALRLGPGHTVVTVACDSAARYQSRLFCKEWLESKGLLEHLSEEQQASLS